jgi:hypothetical protein
MFLSVASWESRSFLYLVSVWYEKAPTLATAGTRVVSVQNSVLSWSPTEMAGMALPWLHWQASR